VIAPGINTGAEALVKKAAMLSRVQTEAPDSVIGRNTRAMMQSGIFYGAVGQIDGILARLKKEWVPGCRVIATGGFVSMISRHSSQFDTVDPNLTLHGLRHAWDILRVRAEKGD
jgi:type III pantothenate kinase